MTSVRHTNGDYLSTNSIPTDTGDWIFGCWIKCNSGEYGGGGEHVPLSWADGTGFGGVIFDVGISSNTTLTAAIYRNSGAQLDQFNILTGSDTTWTFVSVQHASGSSDYTVRWRKENVTTFSSHTLNTGAQVTLGGSFYIGTSAFSEHAIDSDTRHFFCQATTMSDATLLIASQNINSAPAGTNLHWLDLDSSTNANVNGGTAGNWTTTGTLTTDSTEPTEAGSTSAATLGILLPAQPKFFRFTPLPDARALSRGIIGKGPTARNLTLLCSQGSYTLTGQAMLPKAARLLTAVQGSYTLTGQTMAPQVKMPAAQGSYALTGQALTLTRSLRVALAQGSYALTGQVMLPKAGRLLTAAQGSYLLTGQSLTLSRSLRIALAQGSYTLTGQPAALGVVMPCSQGSYSLTGQALTLTRALRVSCAQGSYTLTGEAATLTYSPVGSHTLACDSASYTFTGRTLGLTAARHLAAVQGSYALAGQALGLSVALAAAQGSYSLTGQAMLPKRSLRLVVAQGSYVLNGQSATLTFSPVGSHTLSASGGSYALTGNTAGLFAARRLVASLGTYAVTGQPANLNHGRPPLAAVSGAYSLTGSTLAFVNSRSLLAAPGSYALTGRAATFRFSAATILVAPPPRYRTRHSRTRSRTRHRR